MSGPPGANSVYNAPMMRAIPRNTGTGVLALIAFLVAAAAFAQVWPQPTEADREEWQRVPDILAALQVSAGSRVADIGAGTGFFTVRLARAVGPGGRVFAVDINPRLLHDLQQRLVRENHENVEIIAGDPNNPHLPTSLDGVLIVNAYHEMDEYRSMLESIRQSLKLEGRLVIVEPIARHREATSRAEQRENHEIAMRFVVEDLQQAGFQVVERRERFVENLLDRDTEWLIVATPAY